MIYRSMDELPEVMTPIEVKDFFQVGLSVIYRLLRTKELSAEKVGGQWRVRKSDVDAFIERGGSR